MFKTFYNYEGLEEIADEFSKDANDYGWNLLVMSRQYPKCSYYGHAYKQFLRVLSLQWGTDEGLIELALLLRNADALDFETTHDERWVS